VRNIATILFLALLTAVAGAQAQGPPTEAQPAPQPESLWRRLAKSRPYRFLAFVIAFLFGAGTIAQTLIALWGPFWPTPPDLKSIGDDFALPFLVDNGNKWFDIANIQFKCFLSKTVSNKLDSSFNTYVGRDMVGIAAGAHHSYTCRVAPEEYDVTYARMFVGIDYLNFWHGIQIGERTGFFKLFTFEHGKWLDGPID
jgi:hypothetical protein